MEVIFELQELEPFETFFGTPLKKHLNMYINCDTFQKKNLVLNFDLTFLNPETNEHADICTAVDESLNSELRSITRKC